jgi:Co/Zn/Cd efflux system component
MVPAAYGLLKDSGRVLLEMTPEGRNANEIGRALVAHPHVAEAHDLHVWEVGTGFSSLSGHVLSRPATTAMEYDASSSSCSKGASASSTRRCKSTTSGKTD